MKRVFSLLCLCASVCLAEDFVLADGTVLHDAVMLRQTDDSVQVRHSGGVQRFHYEKLSPELQERFRMTPEQVAARRAAAKEAAAARRREKEERQSAQRALLAESGLHARYLAGADVLQLFSPYGTLSARDAEYLAAEWNRREALRLDLPVEAERYAEEADSLKGSFEAGREAALKQERETAALRASVAELQGRINGLGAEIAGLRKENAALRTELGNKPANTVSIVREPVYVPQPVYVPSIAPRPNPLAPPRPPMRPSPPRRPIILKPASHASPVPGAR